MKPLRLEVRDFLGIKNAELDFEPGVYVLVGRNGSGKSSLFEAMMFALYGKGIRMSRETTRYIRSGARKAYLRFVFEKRGRVYEVVREIERMRSSAILRENESRVIAKGARDVTSKIVEITGVDDRSFNRIFFIPQGMITSIVENQSGLRDMIMHVLNFDEFKRKIRDRLNEDIKSLEVKLSSGELESLRRTAKSLGEDPKRLESELERLNGERERLRMEKEDLDSRRKLLEGVLKDFEDLKELEKDMRSLEDEIRRMEKVRSSKAVRPLLDERDRLRDELDGIVSEMRRLETERRSLEEEKVEVESEMERLGVALEELEGDLERVRSRMREIYVLVDRAMPILGEIESGRKLLEDKRRRLSELDSSLEDEDEGIRRIRSELESLERRLEVVKEEFVEMEDRQMDWMVWRISSNLKVGDRCPVCGSTVESLKVKSVEFDFNSYERLKSEIENLEKEIGVILERLGLHEERRERLEVERRGILKEIEDLDSEISRKISQLEEMGYHGGLKEEYEALERREEDLSRRLATLKGELDGRSKRKVSVEANLQSLKESLERLANMRSDRESLLMDREARLERELKRIGLSEEEVRLYSEMELEELEDYERKRIRYETLKEKVENHRKRGLDLQSVERDYEVLKRESKRLEERINEISEKIGEIGMKKRQLEGILVRIEELEKSAEKISEDLEMMKSLSRLLQADRFDDFVFRRYMESVLEIANHNLGLITGGKFELIPGDGANPFEVVREGVRMPINSLSGGEKTLIALMLAMGMSEALVGNVEMMLIDEGFAALDAENRAKVAEILKNLEILNRVIVFITHFEDLKDVFDRKLVMREGVLSFG